MKTKNAKGRSTTDGRFFQMHDWFFKSAAWRATNVYERALYLELKRRFNGSNNGDIAMSHREAEDLLNCSNKPIASAARQSTWEQRQSGWERRQERHGGRA